MFRFAPDTATRLYTAVIVVGVVGILALVSYLYQNPAPLAVLALAAGLLAWLHEWPGLRPPYFTRMAWMVTGGAYLMPATGCAVYLLYAQPAGLAWLVALTIVADVGAYVVGRAVGGPRLWVRISPGKTWSGAIGGSLLASVLGAWLGLRLGMPLPETTLLALGFVLSWVGIGGDLFESALKRQAGKKDSGTLLPGHGGLLDRLDAHLWAIPAGTLLLQALS